MIIYPNAAIFIEVKTSRLDYNTVVTGGIEGLDKHLDKTVLKAAEQLDRTIRDFRSGVFQLEGVDPNQIHRYYPVILTLTYFPQATFIWQRIDKKLQEKGYLLDNKIKPLQIMNAEELEVLDPIMRSSTSLLEIIDDHSRPKIREFPLINYLWERFHKQLENNPNRLLQNEWKELEDRIRGLFE